MISSRISDGLYRLEIPLPHTPLKSLNAYVIRGERNLLIDTGFNHEQCWEALCTGMDELGIRPENTDIFLTHLHADHAGLAWRLQRPGTKVYMSETDVPYIDVERTEELWDGYDRAYFSEGFSRAELAQMPTNNVARALCPARNCDFTAVSDGAILSYGGRKLRVVDAPGHTPGQCCLFDDENGVMFLADHVLFDITPTVQIWNEFRNPLKTYLQSLRAFKAFDIRTPLPGHRGVTVSARERIDEILKHHDVRLREAEEVMTAYPDATAYEIASHMTWHIRVRDWKDYPAGQKWFALGEILAHLQYLEEEGRVLRNWDGEVWRYSLKPAL